MSLDSEHREVRYDIYCEQCKHKEETGYESVCEECLDNINNLRCVSNRTFVRIHANKWRRTSKEGDNYA